MVSVIRLSFHDSIVTVVSYFVTELMWLLQGARVGLSRAQVVVQEGHF